MNHNTQLSECLHYQRVTLIVSIQEKKFLWVFLLHQHFLLFSTRPSFSIYLCRLWKPKFKYRANQLEYDSFISDNDNKYGIFHDAVYFSFIITLICEIQQFSLRSLYLTTFISLFSRSFIDFRKHYFSFSSFAFVCYDFFLLLRWPVFVGIVLPVFAACTLICDTTLTTRKKNQSTCFSYNFTFSFHFSLRIVVMVTSIKCHVHHENTDNTHIFHRSNT